MKEKSQKCKFDIAPSGLVLNPCSVAKDAVRQCDRACHVRLFLVLEKVPTIDFLIFQQKAGTMTQSAWEGGYKEFSPNIGLEEDNHYNYTFHLDAEAENGPSLFFS